MATKANGEITIVDLNDGKSITMYFKCNKAFTQYYNKDTKAYTPDYSTDNFTLTPQVFVSGITADQVTTGSISGVKWSVDGTVVTGTNVPGVAVLATKPFTLTLSKNLTNFAMQIECELIYTDSSNLQQTTVKLSTALYKSDNVNQIIRCEVIAPNGEAFNQDIKQLTMQCDMYRGSSIDNTDVSYAWSKLVNTTWIPVVAGAGGIVSINKNILTFGVDAVDSLDTFKCEITDNDSTSATHGQKVVGFKTFYDKTDPYEVIVSSTAGEKLTSGMDTTILSANVYQSEMIDDARHATFTYKWTKWNINKSKPTEFTQDATFGTSGVKTTRTITVGKSEISVSSKFRVEVTIP